LKHQTSSNGDSSIAVNISKSNAAMPTYHMLIYEHKKKEEEKKKKMREIIDKCFIY